MLSNNKSITITTDSDLINILQFVKKGSANIANKDTKIHEYFSLYIFLIATYKRSLLNLPITVSKSESPDFMLEIRNNDRIGLEHTTATIEQYKVALSEFKKYPKGSIIEPSMYSPRNKLPKKSSNIGIIKPGEDLIGYGYDGDIIEQDWSITMLNAISRKITKLNKEHFVKYKNNELIIQDHSPGKLLNDIQKSIKILKKRFIQKKINPQYQFDKIHIFSNSNFIYDIFGKIEIIDISRNEIKRMLEVLLIQEI